MRIDKAIRRFQRIGDQLEFIDSMERNLGIANKMRWHGQLSATAITNYHAIYDAILKNYKGDMCK